MTSDHLDYWFCYLCNDVTILSMHLSNRSKVSDDTKHFIDLKE